MYSFVTKCRKRRDDKACEGTRAGRAPQAYSLQYAEEPKESQRSQRG